LVSLSLSALCFPLFSPCGYLLKPPSAWGAGSYWCSAINPSFSVQVPYLKEKLW
jgi:hypothetical protein